MDEFAWIAAIQRIVQRRLPQHRDVVAGIGDDAALLVPQEKILACSVDSAVEHVHFERTWLSWRQLGRRSALAALSDLHAMGATPQALLIALNAPEMPIEAIEALAEGFADAAQLNHCAIVGGNITASAVLAINSTVIGHSPRPLMPRHGAQVGDRLYLSGRVGEAALGLAALQHYGAPEQCPDSLRPYMERWQEPPHRHVQAQAINQQAHAAIDISDGLMQDLGHLCQASKVGARLELAALKPRDDFATQCQALGRDPLQLMLSGGEDYELLCALPAQEKTPQGFYAVGEVTDASQGVAIISPEGQIQPWEGQGWRHQV